MGLKLNRGGANDGGYIIENDIHISYRQLEALYYSALGFDNDAAAKEMGISSNTYRNHVYGIMSKLGAKNRVNALLIAIENGMLEVTGHHFLLGWEPDEWVLCWKCNRAFPYEEALIVESKPITIDHVLFKPPPQHLCPYDGCGASVWEGWEWEGIHDLHPDLPEIPEKDVVYKVTWLNDNATKFIEEKRKEIDGN